MDRSRAEQPTAMETPEPQDCEEGEGMEVDVKVEDGDLAQERFYMLSSLSPDSEGQQEETRTSPSPSHFPSRYTHLHSQHACSAPNPRHTQTASPPAYSISSPALRQHYDAGGTLPALQQQPSTTRSVSVSGGSADRPEPLRLVSASSTVPSSSSASSLRSARRLSHSPYTIPPLTARLPRTPSPRAMARPADPPVKEEPTTPTNFNHTPPGAPHTSPLPEESSGGAEPGTPRSAGGSRIASPAGSMSMSQRRGVRPAFPGARARTPVHAGDNLRGLPTPQLSAGARQVPYPSPIPPPLTAPLSPSARCQQHRSAPPLTAVPVGGPPKSPYQISLDEIPRDFVLKKLREMAGKFWYAPQTADCHVVVPIRHPRSSKMDDSQGALTARPFDYKPTLAQQQAEAPQSADPYQPDRAFWPSTPVHPTDGIEGSHAPNVVSSSMTEGHRAVSARRGSLPGDNQHEQCIVFPLHRDYLTTQSNLFRTLFSSSSAHVPTPTPRDKNGRLLWQSPVYRGARLLPTKPGRSKAVYLPLPDPASFGVILHWLYWHDVNHFNHCLSKGLVTWQGVIRNIEYLGLDHEIKLLAGKWWKRWVKPADPGERAVTVPSLGARSNGKGKGRAIPPGGGMDFDNEDGGEESGETDSGDEADVEDFGRDIKVEDGFADGVSASMGML